MWHPMVVPKVLRPIMLLELTTFFVPQSTNTIVWLGVPWNRHPTELIKDSTLAIEPHTDSASFSHLKPTCTWPHPDIIQSIGSKLRLLNNTEEPSLVYKNDHLCQVHLIVLKSPTEPSSPQATELPPKSTAPPSSPIESIHRPWWFVFLLWEIKIIIMIFKQEALSPIGDLQRGPDPK